MAPQTLPIFPLETPVLFPRCLAPLHIFEPRYRAMVSDALVGARHVGMATVRPEAVGEMPGDPPIFSIGCAGFIAQHQRFADGRYLIALQATARFRVLRELPRGDERAYRVAEVETLGEELGDAERARGHREQVLRHLREVFARDAERRADVDLTRLDGLDPVAFACELSQALRLPALEKQALLEASSAEERLDRLAQTLAFYRSLAAGGETLGTVH